MLFSVGDILVGNDLSNKNYGVFCKRFNVEAEVTAVEPGTRGQYRLKVIKTTQEEDMGYEMRLPAHSVEENMELARELTPDELFDAYLKGSITEKEYTEKRGERG